MSRSARDIFCVVALLLAACGSAEVSHQLAPATAPEASVVVAPTTTVSAPTAKPITRPASGSDWRAFHGGPSRSGASTAIPIKKPRILWKAKVGIQGWLNSPIVIGSSLVIVPSSGTTHNTPDGADGVYALDFASGKEKWHAKFDRDANAVAANDDIVLATSDDRQLYALDLSTGKTVWKARGTGKIYAHPLVIDDQVVIGDAAGMVRAYAVKDGKPRWSARIKGAIRGGASADAERIYVASEEGDVVALKPTGEQVWVKHVTRPPFSGSGAVPIQVYSPPIVSGDAIIVPFARDTGYATPALIALDRKTGEVVWRASGTGSWGNIRSTPALVDGRLIYSEPYSGDVVAINAAKGNAVWRKTVGACFFPQWASPAAAGSTVYVPRFDGTLYAVDAGSGTVTWSIYLGDSKSAGTGGPAFPVGSCEWKVPSGSSLYAPVAVAADGTVFAGSEEGFLYALGERQ